MSENKILCLDYTFEDTYEPSSLRVGVDIAAEASLEHHEEECSYWFH